MQEQGNALTLIGAYFGKEPQRSLVSDYLKWKGWEVVRIMDGGKQVPHPYASPARIINEKLTYPDDGHLFPEEHAADR